MLANRFSKLEDGANKTALAMAIFGRAGANILPVMKDGAEGIKKLREEAVKSGVALSEKEIKKLDDYGDAIDRAGMIAKSTAGRIAIDLVGAIESLWKKVEEYGPKLELFFARMFGGEADVAYTLAKNAPKPPPKPGVAGPPKEDAKSLEAAKAARAAAKVEMTKAAAEKKKLEEEGLKHALKLLEEQSEGLALFYGDATKLAEIAADEDIKRGEKAIKTMKDRETYAEELRGTMAMVSLPYDPEMDLVEGMKNLGEVTKEVSPLVNLMMDEYYQKTEAIADLTATVFRGTDGVIADVADSAIRAFHGMTEAIVDFALTGKLSFTDFANSVIADLMRIAVRQAIVGPIAQGLMGAFGFSLPERAAGGPVIGGVPYKVGERGIETFVPETNGTIVPNGGLGRSSVTVNIKNQSGEAVEARTARASFDPQGWVIDVVLDGLNRNVRGLRTAMGGA
jgi:Lambda phage tail tape-measure protein (Tape_meas_lam_C)